jgi:hypothetical protein
MNNKDLIKSFKQGGTGNCVSIAIIKASIEIFGLDGVFESTWNDQNCDVIMRDGFELTFTIEEHEIATNASKFELLENKEVFDFANLAFTAMVKRAQMEDNDGNENMSFLEAIDSLNKGELYLEGPHWLGVRQHMRSIGRRYIWQYRGVIGASSKHCFFASKRFEDNYGRIDRLGRLERRFCKWFRIDEKAIF